MPTHEQRHLWLNARSEVSFQERGGPRSLSGEPIEETTIPESNGAELQAAHWNGAAIPNTAGVTN